MSESKEQRTGQEPTNASAPFSKEKMEQAFKEELAAQGRIDLTQWFSEIPAEYQTEVIPQLWAHYVAYFQEHGWTVHRPEAYKHLLGGVSGDTDVPKSAEETTAFASVETRTNYLVQTPPWKEGGQGLLYKAHDTTIDAGGREVVLKFLKDPDQLAEFNKEIAVAASLEHPGVAAVYSHGWQEPQGRRFYAMRRINGDSLEEEIARVHNRLAESTGRRRFRREQIAPLLDHIISACSTVAQAHSVGVLHCDLKPRNIVCGEFQATIVVDWGSARRATDRQNTDRPQLHIPEESSGSSTIAYASPEQVRRDEELTTAADVYCLGATLYQALTGGPPFGLDRVAESVAPAPREKNKAIPRRLEAICLKAMAARPADRYASPEDLARDLTNWLRDDEISAAPDSIPDRLFRFARRHKQLTIVSIVCGTALLVLAAFLMRNVRYGERVSGSLDSAFTLIEGLCEPLENDAVANSSEFDVGRVVNFTEEYIKEMPDPHDKLARAHQLAGLAHFYNATRANKANKADDQQVRRAKAEVRRAIKSLENAYSVYHATGNDYLLASNEVRRSRWLQTLARLESDESGLSLRQKAFGCINRGIKILKRLKQSPERDDALAEAHQLKGELLLVNKGEITFDGTSLKELPEGERSAAVAATLERAVTSFTRAISLRAREEISRELARGYGYRGDVHTTSGNYTEAVADYFESLRIRKEQFELDDSDEQLFQLARGWANPGYVVRDMPLGTELPGFDDPNRSVEEEVNEEYLEKAIAKTSELAFDRGDRADSRPREDYIEMNNLAAEIWLFGALRVNKDGQNEAALAACLAKAEHHADQLLKLADEKLDVPESFSQRDRIGFARGLMIKLQVAVAQGRSVEDTQQLDEQINGLLGIDFRDPTFDELFVHAVALAAVTQARINHSDVEVKTPGKLLKAIELLNERGATKTSRLQKHLACFPDLELE